MSCYNTEHGTILVPSAQASKVKRAVLTVNNTEHERIYQQARKVWREKGARWVRLRKKGDHNVNFEISEAATVKSAYYGDNYDESLAQTLHAAVSEGKAPSRDQVCPKKVAVSKDQTISLGEASITFDGRKVTWSVYENNHAVERANEHPVAVALWKTLNAVNWTRGSGGKIEYADEYQRDAFQGSSISKRFGPRGKVQKVVTYR